MVTPALDVVRLVAGYSGVPVVHEVSLRVEPGEVVALLGPNGSGKTTTLTTIAGVIPAIAGEIRLLSSSVFTQPPHVRVRKGLALVPENRAICSQLTAADNLRLVRQRGSASILQQAMALFPALQPVFTRRAGLLSGGEQQMLAIAKAFSTQPRVLMIDELSLGLAPVVVRQLLPVIREYATGKGLAVLLVEQHIDAALDVADRAYVLRRGRVVLEGSAAEVSSRRELIEAQYVGASGPGIP